MAKNEEVKNREEIKLNLVNNKKNNKEESKNHEEEDLKNRNNVQEEKKEEDLKNNNDEDKKNNNYRYLNKNNDKDTNENINDKLSSLYPRSNYNKSIDNKNSSIREELEIVGLSKNDILKDKLSEFFVGTSVATSNNKQNNPSLHNNYGRPKSEISGINRQLISSNKSNTENGNDNKRFGTGETKEKYDTEETINNKETGNNTDEKYKEQNNENAVLNGKRLLRNELCSNLEGSSSLDN